ncbi:MAG: U32 family peptidase [Candidatus Omnitrophica bacterium]|nr:U32 family peptidase [Candidatus Omnitrophota bacterium]
MQTKPELLAPAGNWSSLKTSVESGADSVYFGVKGLNMRNLSGNFDVLELPKVMAYLREHHKKGYLTLNTVVQNEDMPKVRSILRAAGESQVDAVILWDMGIFQLARAAGLTIHLSTQASVSNIQAVSMYARLGVKRIVLARECTLEDIRSIKRQMIEEKIDCELEGFIHGAMCVSVSGRCFMSSETFGQSANRGECIQPCRREYTIIDQDGQSSYVLGEDYVLSAKDLCSLEFIDQLMVSGLDSFKIEGRLRSPEYAREVVACYRTAIDACRSGTFDVSLKTILLERLRKVYHRGFSTGFYFGQPGKDDISRRLGHEKEKIYIGDIKRVFRKINVGELHIKCNDLKIGDQVIIMGKTTSAKITTIEEMQSEHQPIPQAGRGEKVGIKIPPGVKPNDKVFLWQNKMS